MAPKQLMWRTRTFLKALLSIALTAGVFYIVFSRAAVPSFGSLLAGFTSRSILVVLALMIAGTALSAWRLKLIADDLGYRLSVRDAVAALSLGALAGNVFFQLIGQLMARGALLARRGMPVAATVTLTIYERAAAAAVSLLLAIAGGWYVFGRLTLDIQHGGQIFIKIAAGLALALAAGGWLAWGQKALAAAPQNVDDKFFVAIGRNLVLSTAIQFTTMGAYVAAAHSIAPAVPLIDLAAASSVVMLAASLPISFAGWGVRELSAVLALGIVGVPSDAALVVAVLIGIGSLLVIGAFAISSFWAGSTSVQVSSGSTAPQIDYDALLAWAVPILAATAVFFQLYIPVGHGELNVNLADPLAVLGGGLFVVSAAVYDRRWPKWRLPSFNIQIVAITTILLLALLHGAMLFGWTSWALTNRFIGWFILLGYGATGALIVKRADQEGIAVLLRTFAVVCVAVIGLDMFLIVLTRFGVELPNALLGVRMAGFAQNPNAFAFQILLAICAAVAADFRPKIASMVLAMCLAGVWLSASRAVFIGLPFVFGFALYSRVLPLRRFVTALLVAAGIVMFLAVLPTVIDLVYALALLAKYEAMVLYNSIVNSIVAVYHSIVAIFTVDTSVPKPSRPPLPPFEYPKIRPPSSHYDVTDQLTGAESSNVERLASLLGARDIFLAHPIIGGGLGAFMVEHLQTAGKVLVIHSTPAWLLAETGILGFLVILFCFSRIFFTELKRSARDLTAALLVLSLLTMGIVSLFHELFYQRAFWLLVGAAMAMMPRTSESQNKIAMSEPRRALISEPNIRDKSDAILR